MHPAHTQTHISDIEKGTTLVRLVMSRPISVASSFSSSKGPVLAMGGNSTTMAAFADGYGLETPPRTAETAASRTSASGPSGGGQRAYLKVEIKGGIFFADELKTSTCKHPYVKVFLCGKEVATQVLRGHTSAGSTLKEVEINRTFIFPITDRDEQTQYSLVLEVWDEDNVGDHRVGIVVTPPIETFRRGIAEDFEQAKIQRWLDPEDLGLQLWAYPHRPASSSPVGFPRVHRRKTLSAFDSSTVSLLEATRTTMPGLDFEADSGGSSGGSPVMPAARGRRGSLGSGLLPVGGFSTGTATGVETSSSASQVSGIQLKLLQMEAEALTRPKFSYLNFSCTAQGFGEYPFNADQEATLEAATKQLEGEFPSAAIPRIVSMLEDIADKQAQLGRDEVAAFLQQVYFMTGTVAPPDEQLAAEVHDLCRRFDKNRNTQLDAVELCELLSASSLSVSLKDRKYY